MPKVDELEKDAELLERGGDLNGALERWRRLVTIERSRYHLVNQGRLALELGLFAEAEEALWAAVEIAPRHPEAYFRLGSLGRTRADLKTAVRMYRQGLEFEDDPVARLLLAAAEDALGLAPEARRNFERVIADEPGNDEAWCGLGLSLRWEDRPRAMTCFRRAIELDPGNRPAHRELGLCLWLERELEEAEQHLRIAIGFEHSDAWAHCYLGHVCLTLGRVDEAESEFKEAIDAWPQCPFFHCELAVLYEGGGRIPDAEAALLTALSLDTNDPHANRKYGEFLRRQGKVAKASVFLMRAAAADPTDDGPMKILPELGLEKDQ